MSKKVKDLKWETVSIEGFPINKESFQGFVALEECTDYSLDKEKIKRNKKKPQNKNKVPPKAANKIIKLDTTLNNGFTVEKCERITPSLTNNTKENSLIEDGEMTDTNAPDDLSANKNRLKLGENVKNKTALTPEDMLSWAEFKFPEEIIKALTELGFKNPTRIQQLTLPAAIYGRRDILGAAETGSGKTLAFGLPILTGIMKLKEKANSGADIYDIPYKKTSTKRPKIEPEVAKCESKKRKHNRKNVGNKKSKLDREDKSSEDGYMSGDNMSKTEAEDDCVQEIVVPYKKREILSDEGHDSDSDEYVHLSDMIGDSDENDGSDANSSDDSSQHDQSEGIGCVKVIDDVEIPSYVKVRTGKPLYALILTPTRELAIQISRHLIAAGKYTGIKIATIVGGMAAVKQERVLRSGPEVVVATPGRLWELMNQGQTHLQQIDRVKFLAIDETDRMVERGHFEELEPLLERLNADEGCRASRQNFVFSATLTLVHDLPLHMKGKKITKRGKIVNRKIQKMTSDQKVKKLINMIGMSDPKMVDITKQNFGTAETLTESRVVCSQDLKDVYLYYILKRHPGRTIVFCNSINSVKRLSNLLTLLECRPLPLHASMPQRQRLKNLERFRDDPCGILVATDVAARGLDIPDVDHVLHYQVPRTAENYVHRSGRTARANKEGLTILMMDPTEAYRYAKLCKTLNKATELPLFPILEEHMTSVKRAVCLARDLEVLMLRQRRAAGAQGWTEKVAREMDILLDEDYVPTQNADPALDKTIKAKKKELKALLSRPMFPKGFSLKFPTLNNPEALVVKTEKALEVMKKSVESGQLKKVKRQGKNAPLLRLEKICKRVN